MIILAAIMQSFQSKILYTFLKISRYKKWWPKNEANLSLARRIDKYSPPSSFYKQYKVDEKNAGLGKMYSLYPHHPKSSKHIFYIPGGGYVRGPLLQHWKYLDKLIQQTGFAVSIIIYPKAPEHNFKDGYECIWDACTEVLKTTKAEDIIFMGDSAGGALAIGLSLMLKEKQMMQPKQLILLFPWIDASLNDPDIKKFENVEPMLDKKALQKIALWYAAGEDLKNPLLSPLYADISGLAPITIITGTYDILWTDMWKFWDKAKAKNLPVEFIEFDKMIHGFTHTSLPEAKEAMKLVVKKIMQ